MYVDILSQRKSPKEISHTRNDVCEVPVLYQGKIKKIVNNLLRWNVETPASMTKTCKC